MFLSSRSWSSCMKSIEERPVLDFLWIAIELDWIVVAELLYAIEEALQ